MAFINYDMKQDMQDDTYKIVAIRLNQALEAIIIKDVTLSYSIIEGLFLLIGSRLKEREKISRELKEICRLLYTGKRDSKIKSQSLDLCKKTYAKITKDLDKAGILLRAEADPNELYKKGGRA